MDLVRHQLVILLILMTANLVVEATNGCKLDNDAQNFSMCIPNQSYTVNCRHLSLTEVPESYPTPILNKEACALDLSLNNFSKLINDTFLNVQCLNISGLRVLILSSSNISYISTETFRGLNNLQLLNLSNNHLSYPGGFGKGVFKSLIGLKYLDIKGNNFSSFHGLGKELSCMQNLQGIYAELCCNCTFDEEFQELKNLKNISLSGRSDRTCNASRIHNNTFKGLTMLKGLWLSSCNILEIEANAFKPMNDSLTHLDISYNEQLGFSKMNTALYGLRFSSKLSILNVNRIHNVHDIGVKLNSSDLEYISTFENLTKLYMDLNKIEIFDKGIFYPVSIFPSSLRVLTFAENRLSYGEYVKYIHNAINITCLDISRQHLYYDPFINEHYEFDDNQKDSISADRVCFEKLSNFQNYIPEPECTLKIPPNLRRLKWRKSFLNFDLDENVTICQATNLVHLDLSFNLFTKWKTSIKGLENLKHLDLSENYCSEVTPGFFDHFKQLESLNLAGNYLGIAFGRMLGGQSIFKNLTQLRDLDLSNNRIEHFTDPGVFKGLAKLQKLRLHTNLLSKWNYDMPVSKSLILIDLSQNKLTRVPKNITTQLNQLCQDSCNITMRLSNNSFECDCDNLPFFKWICSSKVTVDVDVCRFITKEQSISHCDDLLNVVNNLENCVCIKESRNIWTVGTICVVLGSFTSLAIALFIHRYRWKLRYLYYRRNRRFNHEGFERLFENDAFVSYAKSNASFMKNYMVPALEKEHGLRLWVADRNSMPGTSIAENIIYGINSSQKSVLLIDKAYLKDSWCEYEMNMAHIESTETKRKLIIIVLMEDIPMQNLPMNIMRFLRSERSLEYPEHNQDLDTFWTNLADEIMC